MTKNKFIKTLRSWGASESTIKNYTNAIASYGGAVSYDDMHKILREIILKKILENYTPNRLDIKLYDFNLSETSKDNYLLMNTFDAKVVEPSYVVNISSC